MKFTRWVAVAILGACSLLASNAHAESVESSAVLEKLAALEARVASLERKNQEYKRQLDQAHSQLRSEPARDVRQANAAMPVKGVVPVAMPAEPPSWTGAFWGGSVGGAATRAGTRSDERTTQGNSLNAPPFDLFGFNSLDQSGTAKNGGGFIDLFAGGDVQISRLVVGGQLEATVADLNFSSSGTRSLTYFNSAGPTGATATGDYRPQVTSHWMASTLLRAGILLDENTLLYGLGGWTFARFEARNLTDNPFYQPNETFWASGPTGGVGIERRLDGNWRVRAEYRYTRFDAASTQDRFNWVSGTATQTYARATQYDQSMQSARVGFAYAFSPLR
ncbi:outer membrane beta-barrel protein [Bradyrhizobium sp. TM233]|uniref:outer membrane beta-barrel protein n=1 Tax=Bradyrhizobium sp. TM233 TaxID=2599801 RepID=UPI0027D5B46D|nr:outer membrane beta-barrel protein [Bradyrhizobium sp. TM233]